MRHTNRIIAAGVASALTVTAEIAVAQELAATGLEEVVVTARKRTESLLQIPVAVTAITAESISDRQITSLYDVSKYAPSLEMNLSGTSAGIGSGGGRWEQAIAIRGIPTASVYIDFSPTGAGIVQDINDVERVEVLRGPQAAYFGRSTFAGAINIVVKPPGDEFAGQIDGLLGNFKSSDLRVTVEGPIVPEKLAFRLSGRTQSMDGYYKNNGDVDATLGGTSTRSLSGQLVATPNDKLHVQWFGNYNQNNDGPPAIAKWDLRYYNCNADKTKPGGPLNYVCGKLPTYRLSDLGEDGIVDKLFNDTVINNSTGLMRPVFPGNYPYLNHTGSATRIWHTHLKVDYDIPGIDATLTSLSTYNALDNHAIQAQTLAHSSNLVNPGFPATPNTEPYVNYMVDIRQRNDTKDQEFRLVSAQSQRFRWIVGGGYDWKLIEQSLSGLFPTGPTRVSADSPSKTRTWAGFFGLSYDFLPQLTLDVEGRYQADTVNLYLRPDIQGKSNLAAAKTFKNFTPRVNLSYKMTPEVMFYATYGQGVNPGAFNSSLLTLFPNQLVALQQFAGASLYVQPEKITNYELGVKGRFFDNRVQLSFDGYYERWTNQIVSQTGVIPIDDAFGNPSGGTILATVNVNVGLSEVKGLEFEGSYAPTRNLTFNVTGSLNNSKILRNQCLVCAAVTGVTDVAGAELNDYPKYNANLGAEYKDQLVGDWDWKARADFIYRSGETESFANLAWTPATVRVNLHLGVETHKYAIEGFVTNVFNNLAPISPELKTNTLRAYTGVNVLNAQMPIPRQFGVRGTVKF